MHVIGASGRSGAALCRALAAREVAFVPVVRDHRRWIATGIGGEARVADLADQAALADALGEAVLVAVTAHARHADAVLRAAGPAVRRLVFLGSTRKFTRWPDAHGNGVLEGERALLRSGRPGIMLHPTMIYGASGENNVRRLAALARVLPVLPLPRGGRALVQPIHQSDVTRAMLAALALAPASPESLVIAGPSPLPYAELVRAVAAADGQRPPRLLGVPAGLLLGLAPLLGRLPLLPRIGRDEVRRLLEDKAFDITTMRDRLGIEPISLAEGLALTFGAARDRGLVKR